MWRKNIDDVESKAPDVGGLVTATVLDKKLGEVKNKIPNENGLVTTAVLNAKICEVEYQIPDLSVSGLVKIS